MSALTAGTVERMHTRQVLAALVPVHINGETAISVMSGRKVGDRSGRGRRESGATGFGFSDHG